MAVEPGLALVDYLRLLRRHWWIVGLVSALSIVLAVVWVETRQESYEAKTTVIVRSVPSANFFPQIPGNPSALYRVLPSEAQFASGAKVQSDAGLRGIALSTSIREVAATSVLEFRVTASTSSAAVELSSVWAEEYVAARHQQDLRSATGIVETSEAAIEQLREQESVILEPIAPIDIALNRSTLEPDEISRLTTQRLNLLQQLNDELSPIRSQILTLGSDLARQEILIRFLERDAELAARVLSAPTGARDTRPSLPLTAAGAGLLGIILGVAMALLYAVLSDRVSSGNDFRREHPGVAVLGLLPESKAVSRSAVLELETIASDRTYLESLQGVVTSLQMLGRQSPIASILVTSAEEGAGKSTLAASMSLVVSRDLDRVVAIDCDLRRSRLASLFDVGPKSGLCELIDSGNVAPSTIETALVPIRAGSDGGNRLAFLPAGSPSQTPTQLLRLPTVASLVQSLEVASDLVILDGPPVVPVTDSILLARPVDLVVVVVRLGKSRISEVRETIERLSTSGTVVAAVIVGGKKRRNAYYE